MSTNIGLALLIGICCLACGRRAVKTPPDGSAASTGGAGGSLPGTGGSGTGGNGTGGSGSGVGGSAVDAAADGHSDDGTSDARRPFVLTPVPSETTANLTAVLVTPDRLYVASGGELRSRSDAIWTSEPLPADVMSSITDLAITSDGRLVMATRSQVWTRDATGLKQVAESDICSGFSQKRLTTGPDGVIYSGCPFLQIARDGTVVGGMGMPGSVSVAIAALVYVAGGPVPSLHGLANPSPFSADHLIARNAAAIPFQNAPSWTTEPLPRATPPGASRTPYAALAALADGTVIAVGEGGIIAARRGGTWALEHEGGPALRDVWATGATAVAVGDAGTLLVAEDGTWTERPAPSAESLTAVHGLDDSTFVAVGSNGTIIEGRR